MQTPEMIGSYRPPLPTPMPVLGTYGPSMGPPGPSMGPTWQHMESPGQHLVLSGQHIGPPGPAMEPSWQHMGPSWQHMGPLGPAIEPPGQHIGPSGQHMGPVQHFGPPRPCMEPLGQHMGPSWQQIRHPGPGMESPGPGMGPHEQHMEHYVQQMGPPVQHMGPSGQQMGPPGPSMGLTSPNTDSLGFSELQMGYPGLSPIPQQVQPVKPNYSVPNPNLHPVQPVNQPADNLWVETITPTGKVHYYNSKTSREHHQNVSIVTQTELEVAKTGEINMATQVSLVQTSVQQNTAKDVKTDSEVSSDEEIVEEKKKQTELIEKNKPESKAEQKPESKAEQKPVTKTKTLVSTPIPDTVWRVVQTNDGKHFFYNPTKRQSVWKMPEELKNRPDVVKLLPPKLEVKTEIKEEKDLQEEPLSKKIKLEAEVKEEMEKSSSEVIQEIVKTANAVKVQTAENMPVVSLEDRKKKFRELLAENNVSTHSTWEEELHKVIFDKRYQLLTLQESKQVFDDYIKERAEEECLKRLHVKGNSELNRQAFEESNLIVKLKVEVKEEKEESSSEVTQQIVLEKETTNTVKVQTTENMPVVLLEDRKKQFKELLAEKNVSTHSALLPPQERKLTFAEIVKNRAEQQRMKRYMEIEGNLELFRQLLEESNLNANSSFESFEDAHSHDERFGMVPFFRDKKYMFQDYISELVQEEIEKNPLIRDKGFTPAQLFRQLLEESNLNAESRFERFADAHSHDERFGMVRFFRDKKHIFQDYISELAQQEKERNALMRNEIKNDFMKMLSETPGIDQHTQWRDLRRKLYLDPRYKAVDLPSHRERWFYQYLKTENNVTSDDIRKKEVQEKRLHSSSLKRKNTHCLNHRDAAFEDFKQFLVEKVIDPRELFYTFESRFCKSRRWTMELSHEEKKTLYVNHVYAIRKKKRENLRPILDEMNVASDDIRKKEVQEKRLHSSSVKRENTSCLNRREAAFEDFKQFLVEKVKYSKGEKFSNFEARYCKSRRWTMELSANEKRALYSKHIYAIRKNNQEILKLILDEMNLPLEAEWSEVKKRVVADPRFVNYTGSEDLLDDDYARFMYKKNLKSKEDFENSSSQSSSHQTRQEVYSSW